MNLLLTWGGRYMVTINDVARQAGVSRSTASRAFVDNSSIKPETKKKVLQAATNLGYSPNINARGLVQHKHFMIGVFFTRLHETDTSTYFSNIITTLNSQLPTDYVLSVQEINQVKDFDQTIRNRIDGAIVFSQTKEDDEFIQKLIDANIKTVVALRKADQPEVDNVYPDDAIGINAMVKYLHDAGHRKVGFINGPTDYASPHVRHDALVKAADQYGMQILKNASKWGHFKLSSGEELMSAIIEQPRNQWPSVVLCGSDDIAMGAIKACHQHNVHVPKDISIVGFDDIPYARVMTPSLTTISNPLAMMAKQGISLLFDRINNQAPMGKQTLTISPQLVRRSSVLVKDAELVDD